MNIAKFINLLFLPSDEKKNLFSNNYFNIVFEIVFFSAALLPVFILCSELLVRLTIGANDLRFVEAMPFGRDEAYVATTFWTSWERGIPLFGSIYGSLYYNVTFIIAKLLSFFTPVSQFTVIVLMRSVSLVSYLLSGVSLYFIFRKEYGLLVPVFILICFSLLSFNEDFITRITLCQPDMLNLLLSILVFYSSSILYKKLSRNSLIFSAISVGLFMSVKHSGFIFFPFVFLIVTSAVYFDRERDPKEIFNNIYTTFFKLHLILLVVIVIFTLIYAVLSFLSLIDSFSLQIMIIIKAGLVYSFFTFLLLIFSDFLLKKIPTEQNLVFKLFLILFTLFCFLDIFIITFSITSIGSVYPNLSFLSNLTRLTSYFDTVSGGFANWWDVIVSRILDYWYIVLIFLGSLFLAFDPWKSMSSVWKRYYFIFLFWLSASVSMIMYSVGLVADRYLYPFFPFILYATIIPVFYFMRSLIDKYGHRISILLSLIIAAIYLILATDYAKLLDETIQKNKDYKLINAKPGVQVGAWLSSNCNDSVRIIMDAYAYVPSKFSNLMLLGYGDPFLQMGSFKPDIIILNEYYRKIYNELPDEEISGANLIKAKISKQFYSYFDNNPEYELCVILFNSDLSEGFQIYRRLY